MGDLLSNLALGFGVAFTLKNLGLCFVGCMVGTLIGVLPGVGPIATIAMLLPITFGIEPVGALIMLAGIYYGAQYGGSTTSILVNIPGEATSVVTCLDGHQMAKQGRAGPALMIAAVGSFIGGTVSLLGLMFIAPPLAKVMIAIGPSATSATPSGSDSNSRVNVGTFVNSYSTPIRAARSSQSSTITPVG